jgi:signal transduction histidine kinase
MTPNGHQLIRLEFTSAFEMLDFVQVVSDHLSRRVGLDDDAMHWVGVAIRESVINAIKHGNRNDSSKRVFVEFGTSLGEVPELSIRVRDQGPGIPPEDIPRLFERFYRVKKDREMASGTGLGLPLAKHIVEDVHSGKLIVESQLGHGSTFRVTLPIAAQMVCHT